MSWETLWLEVGGGASAMLRACVSALKLDHGVLVQVNAVVFTLLTASIGLPKSVVTADGTSAASARDIYNLVLGQRRTESIILSVWLMGAFCAVSLITQLFDRAAEASADTLHVLFATNLTTLGVGTGILAFIVRYTVIVGTAGPPPAAPSIVP